jgi:hypothetical protein
VSDGVIAGYAAVLKGWGWSAHVGELRIATAPELRGRGIGRLLAQLPEERAAGLVVATKMGRRVPQEPEAYHLDNFRAWNDRSRTNLGVDTIDLVQLHCPPTPVYSTEAVYDALDTMVSEKRIAANGVSVETCEEALAAIARPGVASVQIILNAFRHKPLDEVLQGGGRALRRREPRQPHHHQRRDHGQQHDADGRREPPPEPGTHSLVLAQQIDSRLPASQSACWNQVSA